MGRGTATLARDGPMSTQIRQHTAETGASSGPTATPVAKRFAGWRWVVLTTVLVVGVGLAVAVLSGMGDFLGTAGSNLQVFGEAPNFALIERSGTPLTKEHLLGKVWVANFIFTRCAAECPVLSNRMAQLQEVFAAAADVRLVSISVDPEYDTPAVLAQYAQRFHAHSQRWLFLTGDKAAVHRLVRDGFYLGLQDPRHSGFRKLLHVGPTVAFAHDDVPTQPEVAPLLVHSGRFVLVDRQGQIRSYCDSNDELAWRRLPSDVKFLLRSATP